MRGVFIVVEVFAVSRNIAVLGAGMVGVSIAYHLARRGHDVILIDRQTPGRETSFGNAGIIQREAVEPYAFPHDPRRILRVLPNRSVDIRYRPSALAATAGPLFEYWRNSAPQRYKRIVPEYASLIMRSSETHAPMIEAAGAESLVSTTGWLELYRSHTALEKRKARVDAIYPGYGVDYAVLDRSEMMDMEPNLSPGLVGAIHWWNSWTVASPGDLVKAYADLFASIGGTMIKAEIGSIERSGASWRVSTGGGDLDVSDVVVALGPWSGGVLKHLGYRLPLFMKHGYHMHYAHDDRRPLYHWLMDAEVGYLMQPMTKGIRLTTGAELARLDAAPDSSQLDAAEKVARDLFPHLGERIDPLPWRGARPCTPDMKPIIGRAPEHEGLWFAFGHGHQGFTLGPVTGLLLAQVMEGETPIVDLTPFSPARFR